MALSRLRRLIRQRTGTWPSGLHTGPSGDEWSSVKKCGPQDMLATPALPGFSIRLGEID